MAANHGVVTQQSVPLLQKAWTPNTESAGTARLSVCGAPSASLAGLRCRIADIFPIESLLRCVSCRSRWTPWRVTLRRCARRIVTGWPTSRTRRDSR